MYVYTRSYECRPRICHIFSLQNQYGHGHTGGTYGGDPEYNNVYSKGQTWLLKATLSKHSNVGERGGGGGTGVQSNQNKHVDIQGNM